MHVRWWCWARNGVWSIFYLKFWRPNLCQHSPCKLRALRTSESGWKRNDFWVICNLNLISFSWMWGDDDVHLMVGVPFFIWKSENQNLCQHSPCKLRALPTSGSGCLFYLLEMPPSKEEKGFFGLFNLNLISFSWMWGMMLCTLLWVFHFLFENLKAKIFASTLRVNWEHSPPLGAVVCFIHLEMPPSKENKGFLSSL